MTLCAAGGALPFHHAHGFAEDEGDVTNFAVRDLIEVSGLVLLFKHIRSGRMEFAGSNLPRVRIMSASSI